MITSIVVSLILVLMGVVLKRLLPGFIRYILNRGSINVTVDNIGFLSCNSLCVQADATELKIDGIFLTSSLFSHLAPRLVTICFTDIQITHVFGRQSVSRLESSSSTTPIPSSAGSFGSVLRQFIAQVLRFISISLVNIDVRITVAKPGSPKLFMQMSLEMLVFMFKREAALLSGKLDSEGLRGSICYCIDEETLPLVDASSKFILDFSVNSSDELQQTSIAVAVSNSAVTVFEENIRCLPIITDTVVNSVDDMSVSTKGGWDTALILSFLQSLPESGVSVVVNFEHSHLEVHGQSTFFVDVMKVETESVLTYRKAQFMHRVSGGSIFANDQVLRIQEVECLTCIQGGAVEVSVKLTEVSGWIDLQALEKILLSHWVLQRLATRRASKPAAVSCSESIVLDVKLEVTAVQIGLKTSETLQHVVCLSYGTYESKCSRESLSAAGLSLELGIEDLAVSQVYDYQYQMQLDDDIHQWSTVLQVSSALLSVAAVMTASVRKLKLGFCFESTQFEWNPAFDTSMFAFVRKLNGLKRLMDEYKSDVQQTDQLEAGCPVLPLVVTVKLDCRKTSLFIVPDPNRSYCAFFLVEKIVLERTKTRSTLSVQNLYLNSICVDANDRFEINFVEDMFDSDEENRSSIESVRVGFHHNESLVQVDFSLLSVVWLPETHVCLYTVLMAMQRLKDDAQSLFRAADPLQTGGRVARMPSVELSSKSTLSVRLLLPREHDCFVRFPNFFAKYQPGEAPFVRCGLVTAGFDDHSLLTVEDASISKFTFSKHSHRDQFSVLTNSSNKTYEVRAKSIFVRFPYEYDFASAQDELVNCIKWLKSLHGIESAITDTVWADIAFAAASITLEFDDSPFEVRMGDNYELLKDERCEAQLRAEMLDKKLESMGSKLPRSQVEQLWMALLERDASEYVRRSKATYGGMHSRTHLFRTEIRSVMLRIYADSALTGQVNIRRHIKQMDPSSEHPSGDDCVFSTLFCRVIELDFAAWELNMRDYPEPYGFIEDGHVWGRIGACEQSGIAIAKRLCSVDLAFPWGSYDVERNMMPLKFFYDLSCETESFRTAYGPCWEPCLAMMNIAANLISRPSCDPSPSLPFWDKSRLLFHGNYTMFSKKTIVTLLASSDPYNVTEQIELHCNEFAFDWSNATFIFNGDLEAYVRTASRYDDLRFLRLPALKIVVRLLWDCMGDPNNHFSIPLCAPEFVDDSSHAEPHDSYKLFRSNRLDLNIKLEIRPNQKFECTTDWPTMLFYGSTVRWLEQLKNTWSAVHRPIKRGSLFSVPRDKKLQITRHIKNITLSVSVPRFDIRYHFSFTYPYGFRMAGEQFHLSTLLVLSPAAALHPSTSSQDPPSSDPQAAELTAAVIRRADVKWSVKHVTADLQQPQIYLFPHGGQLDDDGVYDRESFFMSLSILSYARDANDPRERLARASQSDDLSVGPLHRLIMHDARIIWNTTNRDAVVAVVNSVQAARVLRRNLSPDVLKRFSTLVQHAPPVLAPSQTPTSPAVSRGSSVDTGSPDQLLRRLIDDAPNNFMAYTEDVNAAELPAAQLYGAQQCQASDVLYTKWQFELIDGQLVFQGVERPGNYVLCAATRAEILQQFRVPVWKSSRLLSKVTWTGSLHGAQLYATVNMDTQESSEITWLPKELIEKQRVSRQKSEDLLHAFTTTSASDSVGGVVGETSSLQRIMARCDCNVYWCDYSEDVEPYVAAMAPLHESDSEETDAIWKRREYNDCLTIKQTAINCCTNSVQYDAILDIVNNLVLYVDPQKTGMAEKLNSIRYQLNLNSGFDIRPRIQQLQAAVRDEQQLLRDLGKRIYYSQHLEESLDDAVALQRLQNAADECKTRLTALGDELAISVTCCKELLVGKVGKQARSRVARNRYDTDEMLVVRKFEVCVEDVLWRLTEMDGQIGISDFQVKNFLYNRVSRVDGSRDDQLEIGHLKVSNLLPNSPYRDVLQPQATVLSNPSINYRKPVVRFICRGKAPVGGISVIEHFEINIVPMKVQLTYGLFSAMMRFFFREKSSTETEGEGEDDESETTSVLSRPSRYTGRIVESKAKAKEKETDAKDDIEMMKERAERNMFFHRITIPEVPFVVSYRDDAHEHSLKQHLSHFSNFYLLFPAVDYHERNWQWLDLALAIKSRAKRSLLQQFVRGRFLKTASSSQRPTGIDSHSRIQQLPEEEKARLILGSRYKAVQAKQRGK